jgi:hypothetical protein
VTENRIVRFLGEPKRFWDLPLTVIDRPSGGSQSERTLLDLFEFPTLDSLMTVYASFNDLLAGP